MRVGVPGYVSLLHADFMYCMHSACRRHLGAHGPRCRAHRERDRSVSLSQMSTPHACTPSFRTTEPNEGDTNAGSSPIELDYDRRRPVATTHRGTPHPPALQRTRGSLSRPPSVAFFPVSSERRLHVGLPDRLLRGDARLRGWLSQDVETDVEAAMTQCSPCGLFFTSTYAFDRHRVGTHEYDWSPDHEDGRRCLSTDEMLEAGMKPDARGRWMTKSSPERQAHLAALTAKHRDTIPATPV